MWTALFALLPLVSAASYPRVESWAGETFLDGFNYDPSTYDNTTNGDTFWTRPGNSSLVYTTDSGATILKVDNTTFVPYNEKRYAPKILSRNAYGKGTVWVIDSTHLPYGCSVWPAFWTQGPNWPAGGEIDIMEGINNQQTNQIALHGANTGCQADPSATMTGQLTQQQCANDASAGAGCTIVDSAQNSYGAGFAAAGGGTYITELGDDGVRIWFFTRSAIPSGVSADASSIDTSSLGEPVAFYPSSSCNVDTYLGPQTLTINIALCGDWAGVPSLLEQTCPQLTGDLTCYTTYVINDGGATYANAYFEINYVNIYSTAQAEPASLAGPAAGSGSGSSSSTTQSAGSSSSGRTSSPTTTLSGGVSASAGQASATPSGGAGRAVQSGALAWTGLAILGAALGLGVVA